SVPRQGRYPTAHDALWTDRRARSSWHRLERGRVVDRKLAGLRIQVSGEGPRGPEHDPIPRRGTHRNGVDRRLHAHQGHTVGAPRPDTGRTASTWITAARLRQETLSHVDLRLRKCRPAHPAGRRVRRALPARRAPLTERVR